MCERELGDRFACGGEVELGEVVDVYGEKLLRYATGILGDYQDAEDVVQAVFLIAYQKRGTFDGRHLSAWLYKITYRHCLNQLKKRKPIFLADMGNVREETVDPFVDLAVSDGILEALGQLAAKERALLLCRIMDGRSYEELSHIFGGSPAALRKQYERAKKKLMAYLNAEGILGKEFHDADEQESF